MENKNIKAIANKNIRINKYLSEMGLCSRREADKLIRNGLVLVNDKMAKLGQMVNYNDNVKLKEKAKKDYKYIAYYKPRGAITHSAQFQEKDVAKEFEKLGVHPVGRLDKESEGLIILTNDGRITEKLLSPSHLSEKEYIVSTREKIRSGIPAILAKGMYTDLYGELLPAKSEIIDDNTIRIILKEGKKHQIRIMLSELHLTVTKLKRVRIMNIKLGKLFPNDKRDIAGDELKIFLELLGIK